MIKRTLVSIFIIIFCTHTTVIAEPVFFNTSTKKVHKVHCQSAKTCTKNCIKIDRKEAYNKGGVPCKNCGG